MDSFPWRVVILRASDKDEGSQPQLSKRKSLWRPGAIRNAKITAGKVAGKKSLRVLAFVGTAF
jgi:hypothetical protein